MILIISFRKVIDENDEGPFIANMRTKVIRNDDPMSPDVLEEFNVADFLLEEGLAMTSSRMKKALEKPQNVPFEGDEKWLICLPELDDENAIDWHWQDMYEMMNEDEISNRWWNLLFYARTKNLPNLEEYCRTRLFVDLLNPPRHLTGDLILYRNRSSEFAIDKDLFKLSIFMFLDKQTWDEHSQKEEWVSMNERTIIGIRDNFEKFSHITNKEIRDNVFYWCQENSKSPDLFMVVLDA